MSEPLITIVVVARERFSFAQRALETLYECTPAPFKLVYVDGGSPSHVRRYLETQARARGFTLIRCHYYLSPNEARNIGAREADTKYVVFIDNDVAVSPGWLDALVRCAEETDAWVVAPVYLIGKPEDGFVHAAGGRVGIREVDGRRYVYETERFKTRKLEDVRPELKRESLGHTEFHCFLVRRSALERLGPFDEGILSSREQLDFCLSVHQAGGEIYFEPDAVVTYCLQPPFAGSDLPYFLVRWSKAWSRASLDHLRKKWGLADDDPHLIEMVGPWLQEHRWIVLDHSVEPVRRVMGWRVTNWIERHLLFPLEEALSERLVRRATRDRDRGAAPVVVSRAP